MPAAESRIPGVIERVAAGGVAWSPAGPGAFGALRVRHCGSYPLVESNAVRGRAATLLNADAGVQVAAGARLQATVINLADAEADDIQYVSASRLRGEPAAGVDDVHSHPVEPRQLRVSLGWDF